MGRAPFAALLLLFALPFAYLLLLSLAMQWRFPLLLPEGLSLEHWQLAWRIGGLADSLGLSAVCAAVVALSSTALGFRMAHAIAAHHRRRLLVAIAYLPYAFSPVIYAFCLQFFFLKTNLAGTLAGVLLGQFLLVFPFSVILFVNHWTPRLRNMEALVYTLGGSAGAAWRRVLLPVSRPALLNGLFQTFLLAWFEYGLTTVLGQGRVPTLPVRVYQYIGEANPYFAALGSTLLIWPPLLLLWLNYRYQNRTHAAFADR
ncbi:MAG: ABC transporter permease [Lewinellaceae bacterium]|nr:ABC transporter permease [Lewinellaceae bacterium]